MTINIYAKSIVLLCIAATSFIGALVAAIVPLRGLDMLLLLIAVIAVMLAWSEAMLVRQRRRAQQPPFTTVAEGKRSGE